MFGLFRCKGDLGLWVCYVRQIGDTFRRVYIKVCIEEDDFATGPAAKRALSRVFTNVSKAGNWCRCDVGCCIGNSEVSGAVCPEHSAWRVELRKDCDAAIRKVFDEAVAEDVWIQ